MDQPVAVGGGFVISTATIEKKIKILFKKA